MYNHHINSKFLSYFYIYIYELVKHFSIRCFSRDRNMHAKNKNKKNLAYKWHEKWHSWYRPTFM